MPIISQRLWKAFFNVHNYLQRHWKGTNKFKPLNATRKPPMTLDTATSVLSNQKISLCLKCVVMNFLDFTWIQMQTKRSFSNIHIYNARLWLVGDYVIYHLILFLFVMTGFCLFCSSMNQSIFMVQPRKLLRYTC